MSARLLDPLDSDRQRAVSFEATFSSIWPRPLASPK
jgi:hypothetical protein